MLYAGSDQIAWSGPSPHARPIRIKPLGVRRDGAAVAVQELRREEPVVGLPEELNRRSSVVRIAGGAEAEVQVLRREHPGEARTHVARLLGLEMRDERELVAADPRDVVRQ